MTKGIFQTFFMIVVFIFPSHAQEFTNVSKINDISIPPEFVIKTQSDVIADKENVILRRYVRSDNRNIQLHRKMAA